MNYYAARLYKKINLKSAKVGIIGVGFVGEALAKAVASVAFATTGFDIDAKKVNQLNHNKIKNFSVTDNFSQLKNCDIICICVPTPVDENKKPDLSNLKLALITVSKFLKTGQLVIVESSVAPGTTRNFVLPILESSKFTAGKDFFLSSSPERIDPGNPKFDLANTPKIIAGLEEKSLKLAIAFYRQFVETVISVSSLEVAEMTKVLENTFRLVNISLINELKTYTDMVGVNIWEVVDAAATKPFGFLPHYPGPGVGGHCIPVLPYYLMDSAKKHKVPLRIVEQAAYVNELRPEFVAKKVVAAVTGKLAKNGENPKVLLVGVSYKAGVSDIRESPALKIWDILEKLGIAIYYHDPQVPKINGFSSQKLTPEILSTVDFIIVTTSDKNIPYKRLVESGKPIFDTRNILKDFANSNVHHI